jgi:hypothetical protein
MPLKNRTKLSKTRCGGVVLGKKETAPLAKRFKPPAQHIRVIRPSNILRVNYIDFSHLIYVPLEGMTDTRHRRQQSQLMVHTPPYIGNIVSANKKCHCRILDVPAETLCQSCYPNSLTLSNLQGTFAVYMHIFPFSGNIR